MRFVLCVLLLLFGCKQKKTESATVEIDSASNEVTPEDVYEKSTENYSYDEFFGVYDHESTTKGFSATLSLRQNGNDFYFHVSLVQGSCKGETEGVVLMGEHTQSFYTGFHELEDCRLQFTFNRLEMKVDIKEISLCRILESNCSFEGVYLKRAD